MTLRYVDGFDYVPTGAPSSTIRDFMEGSRYYSQGGPSGTALNFGVLSSSSTRFSFGKCLYANNDVFDNGSTITSLRYVHVNDENDAEGVLGMTCYIENDNAAGANPTFGFYDAVNNIPLVTVALTANGVIRVFRGSGRNSSSTSGGGTASTVIGTSKAGVYRDQDWFYLEIKAKIHDTTGYVEVRVNTVTVISLINVDTKPTGAAGSYFDSFFIGGESFLGFGLVRLHYRLDDLYYLDLDGVTNNDYLGNVRIKTQFLVGAGDLTQFDVFGAATNWQGASNASVNDTTYVYSSVIGEEDLYDLDPIINAPLVHGIQVRGAYRQDDATQRVAHNIIKTDGVVYEGSTDHYTNQSYTFYWDIWELNPFTGVGWTGSEVNLVQIGPKVHA